MLRTIPITALAALLCCGAWAQTAADSPAFEVASVKPSPPPEGGPNGFFRVAMDGGPGTQDPTRIDYRNVSMSILVSKAYGLNYWQLSGPDWINIENYDIAAKVPPGTTKEQLKLMLQNLLAERFKLQVHRETKDFPMYFLTVGKGGPKLKPHVDMPPPVDADKPMPDSPSPIKMGPDGYPILPPGTTMASTRGRARIRIDNQNLAWLVGQISGQLHAPVQDDTGLKGQYDISLYWSSQPLSAQPGADTGPDLIAAVQEQLGLKLEKKKGPVEILVIDHVEKVPTGN
jgi:uncharacterized protein (TIGR03435 family)